MSKTSKIAYLIISLIFFAVFDLYFSELIVKSYRFQLPENPVFSLNYVLNSGAAFNIFPNSKLFLIIFAVTAFLLILIYAIRNIEKFSTIAGMWAAMMLAGIGCNLYERISFGYVRDFFSLNFVDFPVFNISDIFINIGVLAIIIIIVKNKYLKK